MQTLFIKTLRNSFLVSLLFFISLQAQGVSRSHGLGLRTGFWNILNQPTRVNVSGMGEETDFTVNGVGGSLYFFSRFYNDWFFELNLDAIAAVRGKSSFSNNTFKSDSNVDVSTLMPVLFGLRYHFLSSRFTSAFQPYLIAGGGPYFGMSIQVVDPFSDEEHTIESNTNYGAYLGGGTNVMISSWFALNFDIKYHFVDFKTDHDYSGLEFGMGFCFMWGQKREIFQVEEIKVIVNDIYPAFYQFYNTYPLALVSVKNVSGYPIEVNVRSNINGYSARPKESGYVEIERGKTEDIPVTVFFSPDLVRVNRRAPAILNLEIEARAGSVHKKEFNAQIMVHHRNAWNGDLDKLIFFVTSDENEILNFTREIVNQLPPEAQTETNNFPIAQAIFNKLNDLNIRYRRDPNIPFYQDDRVQFANETLVLGSGDCDDLVVLYASLLESLGINTAFVEVQDPQKAMAHLYLLLDTGLSPLKGSQISTNEKRYVIRSHGSNQPTIWIPVETTLVGNPFEFAWKIGAQTYLEEAILRNGISEGWVKIIDID